MEENKNLKGWLILPEGMIIASEISQLSSFQGGTSIAVRGERTGGFCSKTPFSEVKVLFEKALSELEKESN